MKNFKKGDLVNYTDHYGTPWNGIVAKEADAYGDIGLYILYGKNIDRSTVETVSGCSLHKGFNSFAM